jgi:hypothetical protein
MLLVICQRQVTFPFLSVLTSSSFSSFFLLSSSKFSLLPPESLRFFAESTRGTLFSYSLPQFLSSDRALPSSGSEQLQSRSFRACMAESDSDASLSTLALSSLQNKDKDSKHNLYSDSSVEKVYRTNSGTTSQSVALQIVPANTLMSVEEGFAHFLYQSESSLEGETTCRRRPLIPKSTILSSSSSKTNQEQSLDDESFGSLFTDPPGTPKSSFWTDADELLLPSNEIGRWTKISLLRDSSALLQAIPPLLVNTTKCSLLILPQDL